MISYETIVIFCVVALAYGAKRSAPDIARAVRLNVYRLFKGKKKLGKDLDPPPDEHEKAMPVVHEVGTMVNERMTPEPLIEDQLPNIETLRNSIALIVSPVVVKMQEAQPTEVHIDHNYDLQSPPVLSPNLTPLSLTPGLSSPSLSPTSNTESNPDSILESRPASTPASSPSSNRNSKPIPKTASTLYNVIDVGPTLDELATKMLPNEWIRSPLRMPFGSQRTREMTTLTQRLVDSCGFGERDLTYSHMLSKLSNSLDLLSELCIPLRQEPMPNTKYALTFIQVYAPQLHAMSQAFIDITNGIKDSERCIDKLLQFRQHIINRLTPPQKEDDYDSKYEAMLRFHQLFNEYRYAGRSRKRSIELACYKEQLLRRFHFFTPPSIFELDKLIGKSVEVKLIAKKYYENAVVLQQQWADLRPKLRKVGIFRRAFSEAQADKLMECASHLIKLCVAVHQFENGILKTYIKDLESEFLKTLFYIDKNRLCIWKSETIGYEKLKIETLELLSTVNERYVNDMRRWLSN